MQDEPPALPEDVPPLHQGADDRLGTALVEALFAQSDVAAYLLDRTRRIARTGPLSAVPADRPVIGRPLGELYRLDSPDDADALADEVFRTRRPLRLRARGRLVGDGGARHSYELAAHPIGEAGEVPEGVLVVVGDVTEREHAAARARALDAVRGRVGQSLDLATTCDDLTRAVVPDFADIAVVEIVDDVLRGAEAPLGPLGYGTPLRRTAFLGPRGGTGPAHPVGDVRSLPAPTPYTQALSDLRPRVVRIHHDAPWLAADPDRARAIHGYGAHSLLVVPLTLRGTALGLVSFYRCKESDPYEPDDIPFAVSLAAHTALSVDNARRYEREHSIASTVQRRLLPPAAESRSLVAVETAHAYLPGRNSGCWFDTVPLSGARTALSVGRVDGNGIQTAAAMGQLRTAARALASIDLEPDELLARLADTAVTMARERAAQPRGDDPAPPLSACCLYGVYDPFTRACTLARAGGLAVLVMAPDGTPIPVAAPEGPTLADHGEDWAPYGTVTVELEPGSLLALCTADPSYDGLADSRPLREVLDPPDRPLRELCDAVVYESPPALDGAVILLARTGAVGAGHQATWPLDHTGHAPAAARDLVRRKAGEWDLTEDTTDSAELVVSELVTNAVRYGTAPLTLRLLRSASALTCEVHDGSQVAPHLRHARTVDEGGRGLFIVAQLATRWGTRYSTDGKTIWAEVAL